MGYTRKAKQLRRCTAETRDGKRCRAWAAWDDPGQRCATHAGRHHVGKLPDRDAVDPRPPKRAGFAPCTCAAYPWPHRPGGGLCRWPDPPAAKSPTAAGARRPRKIPRWMQRRGIHSMAALLRKLATVPFG